MRRFLRKKKVEFKRNTSVTYVIEVFNTKTLELSYVKDFLSKPKEFTDDIDEALILDDLELVENMVFFFENVNNQNNEKEVRKLVYFSPWQKFEQL